MAPQLPPAGGLVLARRIHECEQQQSSLMHLEAFSHLATSASDKSINNNRACVIQAQQEDYFFLIFYICMIEYGDARAGFFNFVTNPLVNRLILHIT